MGSSQTRARTHVPCIGRQILNHCTTREAPPFIFDRTVCGHCFSPLILKLFFTRIVKFMEPSALCPNASPPHPPPPVTFCSSLVGVEGIFTSILMRIWEEVFQDWLICYRAGFLVCDLEVALGPALRRDLHRGQGWAWKFLTSLSLNLCLSEGRWVNGACASGPASYSFPTASRDFWPTTSTPLPEITVAPALVESWAPGWGWGRRKSFACCVTV